VILVFASPVRVSAQASDPPSTIATVDHQHDRHQHNGGNLLALFPATEASGTAWQPEETPMAGVHRSWGSWEVMFHGNLFVQFLYEPGEIHRTGGFSTHQFGSANWGMMMARRRFGSNRLGLRAMLSLEPETLAGCGALNLLATGEMCDGDTIHDRQHPHDLFMELATDYDRPLARTVRWQIYGGLAGEPALGPPGFPHRLSALSNPVAPITHHWIDSTHITFGLVTTGVYSPHWKGEVSLFNGREPDENRHDLDLGPLDSVSGRVTYAPTPRLTLQASAAHLNESEEQFPPEPRTDVDRLTASATYHRPLSDGGIWATTFAYGLNSGLEIVPVGRFTATTPAFMIESSVTLRERDTFFGRAEIVEKPAEDLHVHELPTSILTMGKLEIGYARYLAPWKGAVMGFGGAFTAAIVPDELVSRYYGHVAPGLAVFVNIRPARHPM
jgi:hypothetical protein